ncbi:MAG: DUF5597 domain-containing protein, partial [Pseudomonadota bacterium]
RAGDTPGRYPSGGPLPHLFGVWRLAAPAIDFLSPDIYFPDFASWCAAYAQPDNPLFIPESVLGSQAAVDALYAIGQHGALGFSPFGIDTIEPTDARALASSYGALRGLAPLLLGTLLGDAGAVASAGSTSDDGVRVTAAVLLDKASPTAERQLGGLTLSVRHEYVWELASAARLESAWPRAGALFITTAPDEFIVAGSGVLVTFADAKGGANIGIERAELGRVDEGRFIPLRRLNGDQTNQGRHLHLPYGDVGVQRVRIYRHGRLAG